MDAPAKRFPRGQHLKFQLVSQMIIGINLYISENFGWRVIGKTLELCYSEVISLSLYIYYYLLFIIIIKYLQSFSPMPRFDFQRSFKVEHLEHMPHS